MMIDCLIPAMLDFCNEQDCSPYTDDELECLASGAYTVLSDLPDSEIKECPIYRYLFFMGDGSSADLFPADVKEAGLITKQAIPLAVIPLMHRIIDGVQQITTAYDFAFDLANRRILMMYRVMMISPAITTIYRTEIADDPMFDPYTFMMELTAQVYAKLKHLPCAAEPSVLRRKEAA